MKNVYINIGRTNSINTINESTKSPLISCTKNSKAKYMPPKGINNGGDTSGEPGGLAPIINSV